MYKIKTHTYDNTHSLPLAKQHCANPILGSNLGVITQHSSHNPAMNITNIT